MRAKAAQVVDTYIVMNEWTTEALREPKSRYTIIHFLRRVDFYRKQKRRLKKVK